VAGSATPGAGAGVGAGAATAGVAALGAFFAGVAWGFSVDLDALTILGIIYYHCVSFLSDLHDKYIYLQLHRSI
jgi:hypothetical protein